MLDKLPVELLSHIVTYITQAQALASLSATCHALHDFTQKDGWKVFTRTRFPSLPTSEHRGWVDAAHALTTLSKNWDRKAFIASYVDPPPPPPPPAAAAAAPDGPVDRPAGRRRPRGQTMGYQPAIDSYEDCFGSGWADRREVLAWSTGPGIAVRSTTRSSRGKRDRGFDDDEQDGWLTPEVEWQVYRPPGAVDGRDDVGAVSLLRPHQRQADGEEAILGTANGDISLVAIATAGKQRETTVKSRFVTNGRAVRSADLSGATSPLYAACLGDLNVAVYPVKEQQKTAPLGEVVINPDASRSSCRVWSVRFLAPERVAVGLGPSTEPVNVFAVTPSGIESDPLRKFTILLDRSGIAETAPAWSRRPGWSVYPIRPLPATSQAGHANGEVFLSGGYDGIVRLHDMRSPKGFESTYKDNTFDMPVYSLSVFGRERLVAGRARHCLLTFWDLRVSGGRTYQCDTPDPSRREADSRETDDGTGCPAVRSLCAVYLTPRNRPRETADRAISRLAESPVYSLSSPSPTSPFLYAGVENKVYQLNWTSVTDAHPDPLFGRWAPASLFSHADPATRLEYLRRRWDPTDVTLNVAMYNRNVLCVQSSVRQTSYQGDVCDLDSRWLLR